MPGLMDPDFLGGGAQGGAQGMSEDEMIAAAIAASLEDDRQRKAKEQAAQSQNSD